MWRFEIEKTIKVSQICSKMASNQTSAPENRPIDQRHFDFRPNNVCTTEKERLPEMRQ